MIGKLKGLAWTGSARTPVHIGPSAAWSAEAFCSEQDAMALPQVGHAAVVAGRDARARGVI